MDVDRLHLNKTNLLSRGLVLVPACEMKESRHGKHRPTVPEAHKSGCVRRVIFDTASCSGMADSSSSVVKGPT